MKQNRKYVCKTSPKGTSCKITKKVPSVRETVTFVKKN